MLTLTRKEGERVALDTADGRVWVTVGGIGNGKVRLSIGAPDSVVITREELLSRDDRDDQVGG